MKKIIQLVGLSMLVVILPAASWYFLKSGLDYRLESMDKLGTYGQLPISELDLSNGRTVNTNALSGKMAVVHAMNPAADTALIMKLYSQFSKRKDLQFILTDIPALRLKADRVPNLWLLESNKSSETFLKNIGVVADSPKDLALVDISGEIRNFYNLENTEELRQMVEHTAFLLPVEETAKPIMQREMEK